jgi:hypothetical protein
MNKFKPVKGSRLNEKQAQRYGEHIQCLEEQHGGVTPKIVLEDAKDAASPLHDWFEWNDSVAAERYRITQAAYILRSINVIVEETETRAFQPVTVTVSDEVDEDAANHRYLSISVVLADEEKRKQLLRDALAQLGWWRKKYKQYSELGDIMVAIENTEEQLK